MNINLSPSLRENMPLYVVALLLACLFAALALFGRGAAMETGGGDDFAGGTTVTAEQLATLPASADDTVVVSQLAPLDAQARNAAVEIVAGGPGLAKPFAFNGGAADRERAIGCLALAGLAEAGSGDPDQRAVMQVILNRVRHPAFAKTVCGVVFEGSERATGCRFPLPVMARSPADIPMARCAPRGNGRQRH